MTKLILGIETSCDETAAAVVCDAATREARLCSNIVHSQLEHLEFGGVVPEIASRAHAAHVDQVVAEAMDQAKLNYSAIDAVAVTSGPGLIGGVTVGLMFGKALAASIGKPLIGVNHLEGHALTVRMTDDVAFPFLLLLISGGHCQILAVEGVGRFKLYGTTRDDAAGEVFDKVAKMLGLGYPGGPAVEKKAREGDAGRFTFPIPLAQEATCDFSFSGLKTSVMREIQKQAEGDLARHGQVAADICAGFQKTVGDVLVQRMKRALLRFEEDYWQCNDVQKRQVVVAGGVAANVYLRGRLTDLCAEFDAEFTAPPLALCTDNAAMIAWAGLERLRLGLVDDLSIAPRARWKLEELRAASKA